MLVMYSFGNAQNADTSDEYLKYVKEVISEDELYYNDYDNLYESEEENRREKSESVQSQKRTAENERIRKQREESFANEVAQLKEDKAAVKKLLQQKKRDTRIVNRIYKEFQSNNYYAVLGIRNFIFSNFHIPNHTITIVPKYFVVRIPGFELFHISEKQINRAYREMAKLVHPDKSIDPRAAEAFLLLEDAATILLNDATRSEYDMMIRKERGERRLRLVNQIRQAIEKSVVMTTVVLRSAKTFLGPLTIPVVVLVALIA